MKLPYEKVKELLGIEAMPQLMMGVGFKQEGVNRREHPLKDSQVAKEQGWSETFPTKKKEQIGIYYIKWCTVRWDILSVNSI